MVQNWQSLARWTTEKRKTQITNIRNESEDFANDSREIKGVIRDCYEQLYAKKLDNLDEIDKFLETVLNIFHYF